MDDDLPRRLEWDSHFFAHEVGRIDPTSSLSIECGLEEARRAGIALLYAFVPGDRLDLLEEGVRRGGRLVDIRVELECRQLSMPASASVRLATSADREIVLQGAARLAGQSRFRRDPRIPFERVEAMYRIWGRKCLEEGTVALPSNGEGGLVGTRSSDEAVHVELVWVDAAARGQGLAASLVAAAVEPLQPKLAHVATQAGNVPALRLYGALGFQTTSVTSILHFWLDEPRG